MTREEAKAILLQKVKPCVFGEWGEAIDMAIEALSAEDEQGVGRYEKAMQKLRDMPRYLNGVKEKQITKISTNYTTEKPNDVVEQKNDVVAEPTDLISRAEVLNRIKALDSIPWGDERGNAVKLVWSTEEVKRLVEKAPSAEQVTGKLNNPCDSLLKADSESCKEQKSKLDLISRADALEQMAQAECGLHYKDCEVDNCSCPYIGRILDIPPADRPSGEWIPCSERLPSKDGCYLVTTTGTNNDIIDIAYYTDEIWNKASRIKAWMPLPKPYCPICGAKMGSD